jgi:hypothetical protein
MNKELAKRLAAAPVPKWYPGMLFLRERESYRIEHGEENASWLDDGWYPDLDDWGTVGGLWAILKDLSDDGNGYPKLEPEEVTIVRFKTSDGNRCWSVAGRTDGEALAYAILEALEGE